MLGLLWSTIVLLGAMLPPTFQGPSYEPAYVTSRQLTEGDPRVVSCSGLFLDHDGGLWLRAHWPLWSTREFRQDPGLLIRREGSSLILDLRRQCSCRFQVISSPPEALVAIDRIEGLDICQRPWWRRWLP